jgi:hypothetical protein
MEYNPLIDIIRRGEISGMFFFMFFVFDRTVIGHNPCIPISME